jgi:glycosyltransferase involved in cell wall biosynthesis
MSEPTPALSIIVPTRNRVESLRILLDSLRATASHPAAIEVVLVVDADDGASATFEYSGLAVRKVVVPPGRTMGALNGAGYRASRGDFVMLLNDDVIARTAGWDAKVHSRLRRYADGVILVHVNDTLMRENLCTFPIVSRTLCELAGGICPEEYVRYRIDDHIEDVFNLLGRVGHRRTVYLPDVVFEHGNGVVQPAGHAEYHSVPHLLAADAPRILAQFPQRKRLVLKLVAHIEGKISPARLEGVRRVLDAIDDPFALRVPGRLLVETDVPLARRLLRRLTAVTAETYRRTVVCFREKGATGLVRAMKRQLLGVSGRGS